MLHAPRFGAASLGLGLAVAFVFAPSPASAQAQPAPEPGDAVARLAAVQPVQARTQVLVLGTFHLRQIAKQFKPAMLGRLLPLLQRFRPDAICVETLPGARVRELDLRRDAGPLYADIVSSFANTHQKLGKPACALLNTTPEKASVKVRELLAAARAAGPAKKMSPGERATLALWMLAAYDPSSAALQWSYLDEAARRAQTAVPADLARQLDARLAQVNEVPAIAVRLARALGLESLEPVDDFEDPDAYAAIDAQLEKEFKGNAQLAAVAKAPVYLEEAARLQRSTRSGDLLPVYALLNSAGFAAADVDAQWGVFLRTHFASGTDRTRLGLWENRNLKIAARIRAAAALHPGGRVLVIYGAAHRPFLEAYLSRTADVEVVELVQLPGAPPSP
jgi:hypothetical protein